MKPIHQTMLNNTNGNCLQACIASIFELDLDEVPNFMDADDWEKAYHEYLMNLGYYYLTFDIKEMKKDHPSFIPHGYHLIIGESPRSPEDDSYNHCVVGYNGEIAHDPVPEGSKGRDELRTEDHWEVFVSAMEDKKDR